MNCPKCGAEMRGIYHVDDDGDLICDHGVSENICLRRRLAHSKDAGEALADEVARLTSQLSQRDQEIERLKLDLSMQGEENGRILEELNALEARLPKTVDGVPVFGGDELWIPIEGVEVIKYSVHAVGENKMFGGTWHFPSGDMHNNITPNIKHCYSTREAAENA